MNIKRGRSGQSLIEYALVLPIFLFLILSFLDLSRALFYYSSLTNAVREATRYAIVNKDELIAAKNNPSNNPLQDKVLDYAFGLSGPSEPLTRNDITVIPQTDANGLFTTVAIRATYTFRPITPGLTLLFGGNDGIELTVQSKMLVTPGSK